AHGHVFVSGGTGDSRVVVFDLVGNVVTTLTNEFGATAMLLDGSTLYIAQTTTSRIDQIDTASLVSLGTMSVSPATQPSSLAKAGGRLWFNDACNRRYGSLDLTTKAVKLYSSLVFT